MEIIGKRIKEIITLSRIKESNSIGILYSGGLDSSIIAKMLLSVFPSELIKAVAVGIPNSYDLKNAEFGAQILGIQLVKYPITEVIVIDTLEILKELNIIKNLSDLSIAIPLFLGMQSLVTEFSVKTVFLGQGADELFGGYLKYVKLYKENELEVLNKIMKDDLIKLTKHQILMENNIAKYFDLTLVYPYLDPQIINFAQSQPISSHIKRLNQGQLIRKNLLRKFATSLGLPEPLVQQPKKAMQYGSGTVKILRNISRNQGCKSISNWFHYYFLSDT